MYKSPSLTMVAATLLAAGIAVPVAAQGTSAILARPVTNLLALKGTLLKSGAIDWDGSSAEDERDCWSISPKGGGGGYSRAIFNPVDGKLYGTFNAEPAGQQCMMRLMGYAQPALDTVGAFVWRFTPGQDGTVSPADIDIHFSDRFGMVGALGSPVVANTQGSVQLLANQNSAGLQFRTPASPGRLLQWDTGDGKKPEALGEFTIPDFNSNVTSSNNAPGWTTFSGADAAGNLWITVGAKVYSIDGKTGAQTLRGDLTKFIVESPKNDNRAELEVGDIYEPSAYSPEDGGVLYVMARIKNADGETGFSNRYWNPRNSNDDKEPLFLFVLLRLTVDQLTATVSAAETPVIRPLAFYKTMPTAGQKQNILVTEDHVYGATSDTLWRVAKNSDYKQQPLVEVIKDKVSNGSGAIPLVQTADGYVHGTAVVKETDNTLRTQLFRLDANAATLADVQASYQEYGGRLPISFGVNRLHVAQAGAGAESQAIYGVASPTSSTGTLVSWAVRLEKAPAVVFSTPLTVMPGSGTAPQVVDLSWKADNTAGACSGSVTRNGESNAVWTADNLQPEVAQQRITLTEAGEYVFTLRCANKDGAAQESSTGVVKIDPAGGGDTGGGDTGGGNDGGNQNGGNQNGSGSDGGSGGGGGAFVLGLLPLLWGAVRRRRDGAMSQLWDRVIR